MHRAPCEPLSLFAVPQGEQSFRLLSRSQPSIARALHNEGTVRKPPRRSRIALRSMRAAGRAPYPAGTRSAKRAVALILARPSRRMLPLLEWRPRCGASLRSCPHIAPAAAPKVPCLHGRAGGCRHCWNGCRVTRGGSLRSFPHIAAAAAPKVPCLHGRASGCRHCWNGCRVTWLRFASLRSCPHIARPQHRGCRACTAEQADAAIVGTAARSRGFAALRSCPHIARPSTEGALLARPSRRMPPLLERLPVCARIKCCQ